MAMAMAGWLFGIQELYCLAVAAVVLTVGAWAWVALRGWDLSVSRNVHPAQVSAGQEARVELAVRNAHWQTSPPIEARDPFDGGRRWARFSIAPLHRNELRRSSYRLPSSRRGVYRLGPLELRLVDPLGLAHYTRVTALQTALTVHPQYDFVPVVGLSSHRDEERRMPQPVIGKGGNEFYTLREYVPGDDLRHVHWRSTARLDDLVIRQPENLRRGRLTVATDLRVTVNDEETVEALISATATLAMSALRAGTQVRVVTTDGWDSGHGSGRGHGPHILDGLAAAKLHKPRPGAVPFRLAGGLEPVVVVTTDRAADTDLTSAFGMNGPRGTTLVIFETAAPDTPGRDVGAKLGAIARASGSRRIVKVGRGESFATAWAVHTSVDHN
jgi:uncharacterized protein (DUF58 family)